MSGVEERVALTHEERQSLLEDDLALANLHSDWGQRSLFTAVERILNVRVAATKADVWRDAFRAAAQLWQVDEWVEVAEATNPYRERHEHDAAGCLDCECLSTPMNSEPCACPSDAS